MHAEMWRLSTGAVVLLTARHLMGEAAEELLRDLLVMNRREQKDAVYAAWVVVVENRLAAQHQPDTQGQGGAVAVIVSSPAVCHIVCPRSGLVLDLISEGPVQLMPARPSPVAAPLLLQMDTGCIGDRRVLE